VSVSETRIPRRLAAIVAADVEGYSLLMGVDEEGTLRRLSDRRQEMDDLIRQYGGRIVNTAGDSVIAEFPSVVAAVECAIKIQRSHAEANAALAPRERVAFRIGIHLGDVLVKDGDLFGDGVNIAARLEQLAEPGGITLSSRVKEEIAGKVTVKTENLGTHDLKNIAKPVGVWRVQLAPDFSSGGNPIAQLRRLRKKLPRYVRVFVRRRRAWALAVTTVLAAGAAAFIVLSRESAPTVYEIRPFIASMSGDQSAKSLASSITNRLAAGLSSTPHVRLLTLDDRNGAPVGAKYAIGGAVSMQETSFRVDARLTDVVSGQLIGATSFVGPISSNETMQDEILGSVGDDLSVEINKLHYGNAEDTPDTQRALRLAEEARNRIDLRAEPARAIELYEEATGLHPASLDIAGWYANALVAMASDQPLNSEQRGAFLAKAKAILDARKSEVPNHRLLIYAQCQLSNYAGNPEAALAACDRALRVLPWSARVNKEIGTAYMLIGQLERALEWFGQAERLDHRHSVKAIWETKAGIAALLLDRYQDSVDWFRRAEAINASDPWILGLSAVAYNRLSDSSSALRQIAALKKLVKEKSTKEAVQNISSFYKFNNQTLNAKLDSVTREFETLYDLSH
jgi:class 3 adenylate cyclase/tetratricopeptide (TPR) repeat protein/TolB-like protein